MKTFFKVWVGIAFIAIGFGIGILILAFSSHSSWRDVPTFSMEDNYEGVQSLDFDIGYGEVNIEEGDTFSIDAVNMPEEDFESYVTDGIWYIRGDYDNMVDIFGWKFSLRQVFNWHDYSPKITITIPKDFIAETVNLKVGAGEVDVKTIYASEGKFSVEAGILKIGRLIVDDKSTYEVGTGEMEINDCTAEDTTIECGIGSIVIDGSITGNNDISCGIGRIRLDLTGSKDDYSYDLSTDIGNVVIDGHSYHRDRDINNDAENNMKLDCGIGNITVDFN